MPIEPTSLIGPALSTFIFVYNSIQSLFSANAEAQEISERISALTDVMILVQNSYENSPWYLPHHLAEQLERVSEYCYKTADSMSKRLSQNTTLAGKCKWVFHKSETRRYVAQLWAFFDAFRALQMAIVDNKTDNLSIVLAQVLSFFWQEPHVLDDNCVKILEGFKIPPKPSQLALPPPQKMPSTIIREIESLPPAYEPSEGALIRYQYKDEMNFVPQQWQTADVRHQTLVRHLQPASTQIPSVRKELLNGFVEVAKRGYRAHEDRKARKRAIDGGY